MQCKKSKNTLIPDNTPPDYKAIPTIRIENYVNRVFIDLLGREATNSERGLYTNYLKKYNLSLAARDTMIGTLQTDTQFRVGDSSYQHAAFQRIYDLSKARFLEGADDADIASFIGIIQFGIRVARLEGDSVAVYNGLDQIKKYENVLLSKYRFRKKSIGYSEMCAAMCNNPIYDEINMNSFNFVNASFDDLFRRAPSEQERNNAIEIIDKNIPKEILGKPASNKNEYLSVLTNSAEFFEAQIRWLFFILLQREAKTEEVGKYFSTFYQTKNMQTVQKEIMKTDEYAQF